MTSSITETKDVYVEEESEGLVFKARDVCQSPFSNNSVLTAEDRATQQMVFDRLPLNKKDRAEFYTWLWGEANNQKEDGKESDT